MSLHLESRVQMLVDWRWSIGLNCLILDGAIVLGLGDKAMCVTEAVKGVYMMVLFCSGFGEGYTQCQSRYHNGTSSIICTAPSLPTVIITSPSVLVENPASEYLK